MKPAKKILWYVLAAILCRWGSASANDLSPMAAGMEYTTSRVESNEPFVNETCSGPLAAISCLRAEDTLNLKDLERNTVDTKLKEIFQRPLGGESAELIGFAQDMAGRRDFTFVSVNYGSLDSGTERKSTEDSLSSLGVNIAVLLEERTHSTLGEFCVALPYGKIHFGDNGRIAKVLAIDDPDFIGKVREYSETKK